MYLLFEFQIDIVTTDTVDLHTHLTSGGAASKDEESTQNTTVLLRMGPHRCENLPDILVECPISHPFFVKDKGKTTNSLFMCQDEDETKTESFCSF